MTRVNLISGLTLTVAIAELVLMQAPGLIAGSRMSVRNVTRTELRQEVNPRFSKNGEHIIFMEFTGASDDPAPWDYRLMLSDPNGLVITPLTTAGVVDFQVLPGAQKIEFVQVVSASDGLVLRWQLNRLDLLTLEHSIIETGTGCPLNTVSAILRHNCDSHITDNRFFSRSPSGTRGISIVENANRKIHFLKASQGNVRDNQVLFTSDIYLTYQDFGWRPAIIWLDDSNFITLGYRKMNETGTDGNFTINLINFENKELQSLYSSTRINPFPRFALDQASSELYFQQLTTDGETELWRINLGTGHADNLYRTSAELGTPRVSPDGSSLVISQLERQNFDIIRLDFERGKKRRLALN